jgi:hypothetical protein
MSGNAKEELCYFKQLRMAVCITALLNVFNPLVSNWCTFEISQFWTFCMKVFRPEHFMVPQVFDGWLTITKWKGIILIHVMKAVKFIKGNCCSHPPKKQKSYKIMRMNMFTL